LGGKGISCLVIGDGVGELGDFVARYFRGGLSDARRKRERSSWSGRGGRYIKEKLRRIY